MVKLRYRKCFQKKRSHVWNHFTIIDEKYVKCSYYSNKVSYGDGSSGNLIRHLKTKHITVPLERNVRQQVQNMVTEQNIDDPVSLETTVSNNQFSSSQSLQTSINSYIQKPITISKSKKIDEQISKLIIKHYHPFSLVEEKEFKT